MKYFLAIIAVLGSLVILSPFYFLASDFYFFKIAHPKPQWIFRSDNTSSESFNFRSDVLLFNDRIIVGDRNNIYALDVVNGDVLWKHKHSPLHSMYLYYSNPQGIVLHNANTHSLIMLNPETGEELANIDYDPEKYVNSKELVMDPKEYQSTFEELLSPHRLENPILKADETYTKGYDMRIFTANTTYEQLATSPLCIDDCEYALVARDSKFGWVKWKHLLNFEMEYRVNADLLFIIQDDGVYAYKHD